MSDILDRPRRVYEFLLRYINDSDPDPVQIQIVGPEKTVHVNADDVWLDHTVDSHGIPNDGFIEIETSDLIRISGGDIND